MWAQTQDGVLVNLTFSQTVKIWPAADGSFDVGVASAADEGRPTKYTRLGRYNNRAEAGRALQGVRDALFAGLPGVSLPPAGSAGGPGVGN